MGFNSDHLIKFLSNSVFHWSTGLVVYLYMRNKHQLQPDSRLGIACLGYTGVRVFFKFLGLIFRERRGLHGNGKKYDVSGKVVILTGAATGLGNLMTHSLAAKGAIIAALDVAPLNYKLDNVHYFQCDVSKPENIKKTIEKVVAEVGEPTILINNAGVVRPAFPIDQFADKDVDLTIRVNLDAPIYFTKHCLPYMIRKKEGHIVNISSLSAHLSPAYLGAYSASKAGLMGFHESMLNDLLTHYPECSIKTTLVMPGKLSTALFENAVNPNEFFFPVQDADQLSDWVVQEIETHRHHEIHCPSYGMLFPFLRDFNLTFRRFLNRTLNGDGFMASFNKK